MTILFLVCSLVFGWLELLATAEGTVFNVIRETLPSCGKLLAALTNHCASPKHSKVDKCCDAINNWNKGLCWCEVNAFNAASNLAMDYYAFQFRAETCNVTNFLHPEIKLPVAGKTTLQATCPTFESAPVADPSESCGSEHFTATLRKRRIESLQQISSENILSTKEIANWSSRIDTIFTPNASLFSIGMSFLFPRVNVKRYLLSRTSLVNGPLWQSEIDEQSMFWRSPSMVSYFSSYELRPYSFGKIEFVTFARCSSRIQEIYAQEEESVRLLKQFVYVEPSDRSLWNVGNSIQEWCTAIRFRCREAYFPFSGMQDCVDTYKTFHRRRRVTCFQGQGSLSVTALHGDTLACRQMFLSMASVDPQTFCAFLGKRGLGRCRSAGCAEDAYNDIFTEDNPRFDSTPGFTCSSKGCKENWPEQSSA